MEDKGLVNLMRRKLLLIVTAGAEGGIGLLLLISPSLPFALLLGIDRGSPEAAVVARIAGAGLLALGIACWAGRNVTERPAAQGLLLAVLCYDVAAAAILAYSGSVLELVGIALWPAVGLHGALAAWCVMCQRKLFKNA
jgi:hypothetical protein